MINFPLPESASARIGERVLREMAAHLAETRRKVAADQAIYLTDANARRLQEVLTTAADELALCVRLIERGRK